MQLKVKLAKICYNFMLRIKAGGPESGLSCCFALAVLLLFLLLLLL